MNRIAIINANCAPFPEAGDDMHVVMAWDADGREYTLGSDRHAIRPLPEVRAGIVARDVLATGTINPDLWSMRVPYGSNAWLTDGMEVTLYDEHERARYGL